MDQPGRDYEYANKLRDVAGRVYMLEALMCNWGMQTPRHDREQIPPLLIKRARLTVKMATETIIRDYTNAKLEDAASKKIVPASGRYMLSDWHYAEVDQEDPRRAASYFWSRALDLELQGGLTPKEIDAILKGNVPGLTEWGIPEDGDEEL